MLASNPTRSLKIDMIYIDSILICKYLSHILVVMEIVYVIMVFGNNLISHICIDLILISPYKQDTKNKYQAHHLFILH